MPFQIHTPEVRRKLEPRARPYFIPIEEGLHIGYRLGKTRARWVVRTYDGTKYRTTTLSGCVPDDKQPANGTCVKSFYQVVTDMMTRKNKVPAYCSFCGKGSKEVSKLIAGPAVMICDGCVTLCYQYVADPEQTGLPVLDAQSNPLYENGKLKFRPMTREEAAEIRDGYDLNTPP